ncbi:MAG: sigma-70 family RNA polymerase sigma factor [Candidatus Zambryskibacteria bacterium]|nr:sigma-70 family RNA polymerase sigma factor [Candidatus Zambryskibacteria bacterium]
MSDEELLRISYKKPNRFGELFDRHYMRFLRIAEKTLRSKDDAEDVVQNTFIRIYKYGKKFPGNGGNFRPWSNTILKNCLADKINEYKHNTISLTDEMSNKVLTSEEIDRKEFVRKENKNYIQFVLGKVDGMTAEIIKLRYVLGKSFKEVGKILKIKSSTARVRIHRSKKIFIKAYKQFNKYEQ